MELLPLAKGLASAFNTWEHRGTGELLVAAVLGTQGVRRQGYGVRGQGAVCWLQGRGLEGTAISAGFSLKAGNYGASPLAGMLVGF